MEKKVSVIIPYNIDRGFLDDAIESVHAQGYPNIELILSQSDRGVSYNINRGIERSTGEYIKYLGEDDILPPSSIMLSVMHMDGYDFIHGNAINFWMTGESKLYCPPIKYPTAKDLLHKNVIHGGTLMYHRRVFEKNMFDESLWSSEEWELNLRLLMAGAKIGYCDHVLYRYRRHGDQKSLGNKDKEYQNRREAQRNMIRSRYEKRFRNSKR